MCEMVANPQVDVHQIRLGAQTYLAENECMERLCDLDFDGFKNDLDLINGVEHETT